MSVIDAGQYDSYNWEIYSNTGYYAFFLQGNKPYVILILGIHYKTSNMYVWRNYNLQIKHDFFSQNTQVAYIENEKFSSVQTYIYVLK